MTNKQNILNLIKTVRESFIGAETVYTRGSCYQFFKILKSVFPEAEAYYNQSHVITKIGGSFYDITGEVEKDNHNNMLENWERFYDDEDGIINHRYTIYNGLERRLKNSLIEKFHLKGEDVAILSKCGKSYTGNEVALEIENETEEGIKIYQNIISLAVHLLLKGKEKI